VIENQGENESDDEIDHRLNILTSRSDKLQEKNENVLQFWRKVTLLMNLLDF
jgi:hypothetical protein